MIPRTRCCDARGFARQRRAGFTLVEMMVVIVIIGILAAIVIVNIAGKSDDAKVKATTAIIKQVASAVEMFKMRHNVYPQNLDDLAGPAAPSYVEGSVKWEPFLTELPRDAWGRPFVYRLPGSDSFSYDIVSLGEDGKDGGEGYAVDLWNHAHK